jgi:GNAT superfamily N-acetyltransferase
VPLALVELDPRIHERKTFDCGVEPLNRYLHTLAVQHRRKGISTTFVLLDDAAPRTILGYYTLSAASLILEALTEPDRAGLPAYPVPAARMGRLAVALTARRRGLGELLLQNAIKRVLAARHAMGVYAVVVEAKTEEAVMFYRKFGFRLCNAEDRKLYLPLGADR